MKVSGRPSAPSRTTMTVEAGRGKTGRCSPAGSADADKDLSIFDFDRVARGAGVPLRPARAPGPGVELPEVPRTPDHPICEPAPGQRTALVRAAVRERSILAVQIDEHQLDVLDEVLSHLA